jgi:hypothetical protein
MTMRVAERRELTTAKGLAPAQDAQFRHIGAEHFGPGKLFPGKPTIGAGKHSMSFVFLSRIVDGAEHVFDLWQYLGNSGTIFRANTTEVIADIYRYDVRCPKRSLRNALQKAIEAESPSPDPATDGSMTGDRCVGIIPPWDDEDSEAYEGPTPAKKKAAKR